MTAPTLRVLSLGAGVQSTTLLLASAVGLLPRLDFAIFADTGWEPRSVYEHLERLEREVAAPAGIPVLRVSNGNLRADTITPGRRFVAVPFYLRNLNGGEGMGRRQCTAEYKLAPIKAKVRELLGATVTDDGRVGRVGGKRGALYVEQWVGISRDEAQRAKDSDVLYARNAFPLLAVGVSGQHEPLVGADGRPGWTRNDCRRFLRRHGFGETPKSACIGCPFHGNRAWRDLRDNHPAEWADAVAFDRELRTTATLEHLELEAKPYLHRSRLPLDEAPIDRVTRREASDAQVDLLELLYDDEAELGAEDGCSPFTCRDDGL
jgi:hypothetical protein